MTRRTIAITAGASGIGLAIATALADAGARVWVCDVDRAALARLAAERPDITGVAADVADPAAMAAFFDRIGPSLDALVSNAGVAGPTARVEAIDPDDWARTLAINCNGAFHAIRCAIPRLRRGTDPAIVIMASNAALFGCPLRSAYVASKWALIGLAKTLAMELGPEGVTVNAICPASVEGPRIRGVIARDAAARGLDPDQVAREYARQSSLRRFVDPDEVVGMVRYLLSDAARGVSGQALALDGHTEGLWLDLEPPGESSKAL